MRRHLLNDGSLSIRWRRVHPEDADNGALCSPQDRGESLSPGRGQKKRAETPHPPKKFRDRKREGQRAKAASRTEGPSRSGNDRGLDLVAVVLIRKCSEQLNL